MKGWRREKRWREEVERRGGEKRTEEVKGNKR